LFLRCGSQATLGRCHRSVIQLSSELPRARLRPGHRAATFWAACTAFRLHLWGYRQMTIRKQLFWATTALVSSFVMAETASAQSTGTAAVEVEQVVVTGRRGPRTIDGAMVAETVGKSRSTITQEFIET